jgi:hypothetical protein
MSGEHGVGRLIANCATTAARTAMRAVSEMVEMTASTRPVAKTMSVLKLAAKETSPTSTTRHQPRFRREEKTLNIIAVVHIAGTVSLDRFFAVNCR